MKILAFTLMLLTVLTAISHSTEVGSAAQAVLDAKVDAQKDVNKSEWFFAGCCLSFGGYTLSLSSIPKIPAERFAGKSPEYVHSYFEEYIRQTKSLQSEYAMRGLAVGTIIFLGGALLWALDQSLKPISLI